MYVLDISIESDEILYSSKFERESIVETEVLDVIEKGKEKKDKLDLKIDVNVELETIARKIRNGETESSSEEKGGEKGNVVKTNVESSVEISSDDCKPYITKFQDIWLVSTIDRINRLALQYEKSYLVKPISSNPLDSEVYFLGFSKRSDSNRVISIPSNKFIRNNTSKIRDFIFLFVSTMDIFLSELDNKPFIDNYIKRVKATMK